MPADLATLTADDFEPRLQEEFRIATPNGDIVLKLVAVNRLGRAKRAGGAFSLLFLSPHGPFLAQAMHPMAHPTLGTLDIFIVPLGPTDDGNSYEAVFA